MLNQNGQKQKAAKEAIGQAVRECRTQAGLTQRQFAEKLQVKFGTVRGWERGTRHLYMEEFLAVADALGRDRAELATRFAETVKRAMTAGFI